jgi:ribonuclease Z
MTNLFQHRLLNQPFGDPALYVRLAGEKKALLIDLGDVSRLEPGRLLKVEDVFVSHTHIDHFIGFDHLLRLNLGRDKTLRIFGPPGIIANVRGKLAGYTWNLVDAYPFIIEAIEIGARALKKMRFICSERFKPLRAETAPRAVPFVDVHPHYAVQALRLDHRIACLAYSLQERFHININKERLDGLGLTVGSWLRELKDAVWADRPDAFMVRTDGGAELPLGELKRDILTITKGQKMVYVADCRGTDANLKKIIAFAHGADLLFCEAAFLDRDRDKAAERGHLTAKQAGFAAREARVGSLQVFHFSPRYEAFPELVREEAQQEFKG